VTVYFPVTVIANVFPVPMQHAWSWPFIYPVENNKKLFRKQSATHVQRFH